MALGGALGSGLGAPWSRVTPRHCAWQAWHLVTSTFVSRGRRGTISHPPSFCVAGVAPTIVLCGRRGTHGTGWRAWVWFRRALVARDAAALCVAGVALGDIHFRFTWQAWHNLISTRVLRGRRGTISHPPSFRVAGVAQSHIHHRFAWQAWHSWHWVARFAHTPLCLTPSFTTSTHHLAPHHLSHKTLSPTIFDTPSFTHQFATHHL